MNSRQVLSRARTWVEDQILTAPSATFDPDLRGCDESVVSECAERLKQDGYAPLGQVVNAAELSAISKLIDDAIAGRLAGIYARENKRVAYWQITNPLRMHASLLALAVSAKAIAVAERYFRHSVYLADVDLRRILPIDLAYIMNGLGYSSSNWHRDTRGRQLKLMVYFSDVDASDSCFAFLPRTHADQYPRSKYFDNKSHMKSRFTDEQVDAMGLRRIDWLGKAGEAMMFDTNVIHRLCRRAQARLRDSITYYYTPGQSLFALDYDPLHAAQLSSDARHHLERPNGLFRPRHPVDFAGVDRQL